MGFLSAILSSPTPADLLRAKERYLPLAEWKFAKSFCQGDSVVPVTWHQQPVLISGRLGGVFQSGRVPL